MHGGTNAQEIEKKVEKAKKLAERNKAFQKGISTVLFFDEANTTEAIGLVKEIMCDRTMNGKPLQHIDDLKIIAACNPYRR